MNEKIDNIYIIGNGNIQTNIILTKLRLRKIKNSHIIITSNFGIGTINRIKEISKLSEYNRELISNNNILYLNKGNLESYKRFKKYNGNYSNIKFMSNYDTIKINNIRFLFLNTSTTINRSYNYDTNRNKPLIYTKFDIKFYLSIKYVISNEQPTFTSPYNMNNIKPFSKSDKWLFNDMKKNRVNMSKIYNEIVDNGGEVMKWFSSVYNKDLIEIKNETKFIQLKKLKIYKL